MGRTGVRSRIRRVLTIPLVALALAALTGVPAGTVAGAASPRDHLSQLAEVARGIRDKLRLEDVLRALSAGGQQVVALADTVDEIQTALARGAPAKAQGPKSLPHGAGSDAFAAEDFVTRLSGMTQSEVSAGWCGRNAVLGFNDTGSFVATLFLGVSPSGSLSFNGWSRSTDAGGSYTDMGALVADPLPPGVLFRDLFGDPVVGCTSPADFSYASLAIDTGPDFSFFESGISVSRSADGGATWGPAVMAVAKDANLHFLDKPWLAVEPGPTTSPDDDILHVTYTDFDFSGFEGAGPCPDDVRTAIEYVRSSDGGVTWSSPVVIEEVCGGPTGAFLQGSQVEPGLGNDVYVAWEHYESFEAGRDIRVARSTDGGLTFGGAVVATEVTPIGDSFVVQGAFRTFLDLQGLAVDRTPGPRSGAVYISWHDGRNRMKDDPFGFCDGRPIYCFGDILFARSLDGGATWSDPVRVNDDAIALGVDQFQPALDVDRSGTVWIAYYDRRRDPRNFLIDVFVARSTNGGARWSNTRASVTSFAPVTGWQDLVVNPFYMGDYIAVAADGTGSSPGVIVAWGDNSLGDANVMQRRF
ncbi:MAG TPA: sialidase family protein [Actinomycetota bacterium]|nr:sialidase family protein [Actinomycetota bacterium]